MVEAAAPRDAATVIVVREVEAPRPLEVLMLRRHGRSGFAASAWVFPGGVVDAADAHIPRDRWEGIDVDALATRFHAPPGKVLAYHVAAARETFEEAGLLLARHPDGALPDLSDPGLLQLRHDLADRDTQVDFAAWLEERDLILDLGALTYYSHWVTPTAETRRYDTRFFIARMPPDQVAGYDQLETTEQRWINPATALDAYHARELLMIFPTIKTMEALAVHDTAEELIAAAGGQESIRRIQPHAELDDEGRFVRVIHPDDPEFPAHLYEDAS